MANKENELTCSEEVRGNCGLPVHSAEASKMAEANSKYSDFTEVRVALEPLCGDVPEPKSLFRVESKLLRDARCVSPLCVLTVIKGPRSFDSCPFRKKSTIKSSTDPVEKECQ